MSCFIRSYFSTLPYRGACVKMNLTMAMKAPVTLFVALLVLVGAVRGGGVEIDSLEAF